MSEEVVLHDFWRSSAAYRVRIALNLKGIAYRSQAVDLPSGDQRSESFRRLNPQGLVPALAIDGVLLTQSLAIIDYLDALAPVPRLVPQDPLPRAQAMARALVIAADIHPINNLRVLNYLRTEFAADDPAIGRWYRHWIAQGFDALEAGAPAAGLFGGDSPDLADVCLVPQVYNARRFEIDLAPWPRLSAIDAALREIAAFAAAAPEAVRPA
jgi:maleylacetoacetate isomerase